MKNTYKYLVLLFLALTTFSCNDAYEIVQDGELNEDATFKTIDDMNRFLSATYARAMTSNLNEIAASSLLTDEVGIGRVGNPNNTTYRFQFFVNNAYPSQIWLNYYNVINYSNRLMRGAQLIVPQNAAEQTEYNSIIAQGRALRAFAHFQLLSYFSTDLKNDNALGVMLLDFVPTINQDIARSSNGQVFSLIESDLEFAFNNVQTNSSAKPWAFVSRNMINALRARMYAYRGNYTLSLQYSQWVLDNSGLSLSNGTAIPAGTIGSTAWHNSLVGSATVNNYRRMWNDQIQGESIWSLARYNVAGMQNMSGFYNTNQSNLGGAVLFDMGRKTFNLLNNGWDIRRYVYIDPTSIVAADYNTVVDYKNNDVLIVDKYPGITGAPLVNDIKIFRISEMLLLKAEALANSGQINGASESVASILKSIRDLRSYAGARPLPIYTNATEAWADILLERRLELCFEGHRYMDLKRLGALANLTIDRDPLDCSTYTLLECSMPVTDNRFTFPIPLSELNGNDLIRNQQNPGY